MSCPTGTLARDVLKLTGEEHVSFLQGLLTQNVETLKEGEAAFAALLSPQGKVLDTMMVWAVPDAVFLDVPAGRGAALARRLSLYKLRAKVDITDVSQGVRVAVGGEASDLPAGAFASSADPRWADLGFRGLAEEASGEDASAPYDMFLRACGVPQIGIDFGENEVFALDINLDALRGIAHDKGCFVGQEVASRMFRKGEIRKRTYRIEGEGLEKGAAVKLGDAAVGSVSSASGGLGLGIVRLDRLKGGEGEITVGGKPAEVTPPGYLASP